MLSGCSRYALCKSSIGWQQVRTLVKCLWWQQICIWQKWCRETVDAHLAKMVSFGSRYAFGKNGIIWQLIRTWQNYIGRQPICIWQKMYPVAALTWQKWYREAADTQQAKKYRKAGDTHLAKMVSGDSRYATGENRHGKQLIRTWQRWYRVVADMLLATNCIGIAKLNIKVRKCTFIQRIFRPACTRLVLLGFPWIVKEMKFYKTDRTSRIRVLI